MSRKIPGINIQWPWSQLLLNGDKTVETRTYPIPPKYIGVELAIIETPGPNGKKEFGIQKARIIGTIVFSKSFKYKNREAWERDFKNHRVTSSDLLYGYSEKKEKWGWPVKKVQSLKSYRQAPKSRGIIFTSSCFI